MWPCCAAVFFLLVLKCVLTQGVQNVKPTDSSPLISPCEPCLTLVQYTEQAATYFTAGTTFVFLAGNHTTHNPIILTNISNVTLKGAENANVTIFYRNEIFITCERVSNLIIEGLTFLPIFNLSDENREILVLKILDSTNVLINCSSFERREHSSLTEFSTRAIHVMQSTLKISSCVFVENSGDNGGAIYATTWSDITVNNSIFIGNRASGDGGAIFSQHCSLSLNGNIFTNNRAVANGGAVSALYSRVGISTSSKDMSLLSKSVTNKKYCDPGYLQEYHAIYNEILRSLDLGAGSAHFCGNQANGDGGAFYSFASQQLILSGTAMYFESNSASRYGGAIRISRSSRFTSRTDFIVTTDRMYFTGNEARFGGGAISVEYVSVLMCGNVSNFLNNSGFCGGAIHSSDCDFKMQGRSHYLENLASQFGGALCTVRGSFYLSDSTFSDNKASISGGAIIFDRTTATINGSVVEFVKNVAADKGGAMSVEASNIVTPVKVLNFDSNVAGGSGGAVSIGITKVAGDTFYTGVYNMTLSGNFTNNTARWGGAVYVYRVANMNFISISASGNSESALYIFESKVNFSGLTNISGNTGEAGGGVAIASAKNEVSFTGCTVFDGNKASTGGAIYSYYETRLSFDVSIQFLYNSAKTDGGAIYALGTDISLMEQSNATFKYNSARNGGGIYLNQASTLKLNEGATLNTFNNHAIKFGGAIYYEDAAIPIQCQFKELDEDITELPYCFMKLDVTKPSLLYGVRVTINSHNDLSQEGGDFLYGGLLDRCQMEVKYNEFGQKSTVPYKLFTSTAIVDHQKFDSIIPAITSQPYQLCFCTSGIIDCSDVENVEIHRGQKFSLSLLAVDQMKNATSTQVIAKTSETARLKLNQNYQILSNNCSKLYYALYSTKSAEELVLYPEGPCRDTGLARAVINVFLLSCPDAFILSDEECLCEERLQELGADCVIDESIYIIKRTGSNFWINGTYVNGSYHGLIKYNDCPADYCENTEVNITLDDPDVQCAHNHSGLLCGACTTNYSLMFGSSRCGECSNVYLILLLPFAIAGIALVVILSVLRLTVATGMINGMILYANILQANRTTFFPNSAGNILSVFIAWLNLDLGIETCFYNGMTAYAQTWLQFAFPIYVWILISLIIMTSRYSIYLSKLVGHNPVAVLATLILMSYTKILKIVIDVYSSVDLDYPSGRVPVWLKDANVPYLQSAEHLLLTVFVSLVLVFVFFPYTVLLLLGYKLYRFSGRKHLRWLNQLKPLLDSYYAPYKVHTRYWTGFLLLIRCVLYIIFSFNSLGGTSKSLLAIAITFSLLGISHGYLASGKIYGRLSANVIETSLYMNLVVLSATTLAELNSAALVYSLVGAAFATMMGIIVYHFHILYTAKLSFWIKIANTVSNLNAKLHTGHHPMADVPVAVSSQDPHKIITKTVIELREPLLEAN